MIPVKTIEDLIYKHSVLEKDLSSGNLDKKLFAEKSKEYSDLKSPVRSACGPPVKYTYSTSLDKP